MRVFLHAPGAPVHRDDGRSAPDVTIADLPNAVSLHTVRLHLVVDDVKQDPPVALDRRPGRAARTEANLIEAARALFIDQGYVPTTLAQIADRAGVAARTVYVRFQTKANLFKRVVDLSLVGDAEPIDVAHRPRAQDAMSADTLAERIAALAEVCVGIADRAGALFEVAAQAEGLEPELDAAAQSGRRATAESAREFWLKAAGDGIISTALDPERLALATDLLICADTVVHIRRAHGWSAPTYQSLINDALTALARPPAEALPIRRVVDSADGLIREHLT
jgi:AcrR family transcriptional regulator